METINQTSKQTNKPIIQDILLAYILFCMANLFANYLMMYPATHEIGEIVYYMAISIFGVLFPYHLIKKRKIVLPLFKTKISVKFVLLSLFMLGFSIFCAVGSGGLDDIMQHSSSFTYLFQLIPILFVTMLSYTLLYFGFILHGLREHYKTGWKSFVIPIAVASLLFGVYHFVSIDSLHSLNTMIEEVIITTIVGLFLSTYTLLTRSISMTFIFIYLINWFVLMPETEFHSEGNLESFKGMVIFSIILGIFKIYTRSNKSVGEK